ncbi:hypothetical protein CCHR01_19856 [Colletotrichum chrysophilum]|uniref:Uncharacterized protein n=1 Tax=Colletotrichum chrysophilum TaxID=1836956 RepID=A0AAD8ZXP6_9PEZI|nr:hypothetical protein CCHR01_19856 [Colletotrichum chrysophilum]
MRSCAFCHHTPPCQPPVTPCSPSSRRLPNLFIPLGHPNDTKRVHVWTATNKEHCLTTRSGGCPSPTSSSSSSFLSAFWISIFTSCFVVPY